MTAIATTPPVDTGTTRAPRPLLKPLFVILLLATLGCASAPGTSAPAAPEASAPPAVAGSPAPTMFEPNPAVALLAGPGFTPATEQWVGSWIFKQSRLRLEIVQVAGELMVSVGARTGGIKVAQCEDVVVAAELSCTIHLPDNKEMAIALRPASTDPTRVDHLTLLIRRLPVEIGGRETAAPG